MVLCRKLFLQLKIGHGRPFVHICDKILANFTQKCVNVWHFYYFYVKIYSVNNLTNLSSLVDFW